MAKQYAYKGTEPLEVVDIHGKAVQIVPDDKVTPEQFGQEWLDSRDDFEPVRASKGGSKR